MRSPAVSRSRHPMSAVPSGVMHCPLAPYDARDELDLDTYQKMVDFSVRHGASSLCVVLHLAESLNLSVQERKDMAKASVQAAEGRVPVIVHVSQPGTRQAIELAEHAEEIGADGTIAIAPYYWKPPADAVFQHFDAILSATRLPFLGYHSPAFMDGIGLSTDNLKRLLEKHPHFIGLKEASHNFETFIELRRAALEVRQEFGMILGVEYLLPSIVLGGVGSMSTMGLIAPNLVQNLYRAAAEGRLEEARKLQDVASCLWQVIKQDYPAPIKSMMEIMGRPVGPTRLPIRPATPEKRNWLEGELRRLNLLDTEPHGW